MQASKVAAADAARTERIATDVVSAAKAAAADATTKAGSATQAGTDAIVAGKKADLADKAKATAASKASDEVKRQAGILDRKTSGSAAKRRGIDDKAQQDVGKALADLRKSPLATDPATKLRTATAGVILSKDSPLGRAWNRYKQASWYVSAARAPARWGMDGLFGPSHWGIGKTGPDHASELLGNNSYNLSNVTGTTANFTNMFGENVARFKQSVNDRFLSAIGHAADVQDTVAFAAWGASNVVDMFRPGTNMAENVVQPTGNLVTGAGVVGDSYGWGKHPWVNPLMVGVGTAGILSVYGIQAYQGAQATKARPTPPDPKPTLLAPLNTSPAIPPLLRAPSPDVHPTPGTHPADQRTTSPAAMQGPLGERSDALLQLIQLKPGRRYQL